MSDTRSVYVTLEVSKAWEVWELEVPIDADEQWVKDNFHECEKWFKECGHDSEEIGEIEFRPFDYLGQPLPEKNTQVRGIGEILWDR